MRNRITSLFFVAIFALMVGLPLITKPQDVWPGWLVVYCFGAYVAWLTGNVIVSCYQLLSRHFSKVKLSRAQLQEIKAQQQYEAKKVAQNAEQALARAGHGIKGGPFKLDDIGVIDYRDSIHPRIVRTNIVPTDSTHLRPFIVVTPRLGQEVNRVIIGFKFLDEQGTTCYTSRAAYALRKGQNFVVPNTWLPLTGITTNAGTWSLQISLDEQDPLAIYEFGWREPTQLQLTSDGEINKRTRKLIRDDLAFAEDESLSLDDLLQDQHGQQSL